MSRQPLLHLASQLFDSPLAILPDKLEVLLQVVGPRMALDDGALQELRGLGVFSPTAGFGSNRFGQRQDEKPYQVTDAGVAIIPINGVLMKKGGWMSAYSGCSSYESLNEALSAAQDDGQVRGILFDVNSPGGSTHGMFDLADKIYGMRGSGKPMYAVANDCAASAAYLLASAADKIYVTRTAGVGSIGVYALHANTSEADKQAGVQYTYIKFGAKKTDGNEHAALDKSARADIQAEVDREGAMFVNAVARNRKSNYDAIAGTEAGVAFAEGACPLLADRVGTFETALAELTSAINGSSDTIPKGKRQAKQPDTPIEGDSTMATSVTELTPEARAAYKAELAKELAAETALAAKVKAEKDCADKDEMDAKAKKAKTPPADTDELDDKDKKALAATLEAGRLAQAQVEATTQITDMCMLAGVDATKFLAEKKTVAEVRQVLLDQRAAKSAENPINPSFGAVSTGSIDALVKQATTLATNSGGQMSASKAMEATLKANPNLYLQYEDERAMAALTPGGIRKYVGEMAGRMPSLGLSAEIGS